jgi:hypothetical protein
MSVKNRRLQGTLEIIPCVFPIEATVSAAGLISGGGVHEEHRIQINGRVALLGDGSVRIAALKYHFFGDGSVRTGHMALIQRMGGLDWDRTAGAPVGGSWLGTYESRGRKSGGDGNPDILALDLRNIGGEPRTGSAPTTALDGLGVFEQFLLGDGSVRLAFELGGTIGAAGPPDADPTDPVRFALLGLAGPPEAGPPEIVRSNGIIAILMGLLLPAVREEPRMLAGEYHIFSSLRSLYEVIALGKGGPLDQGVFELPAVQ